MNKYVRYAIWLAKVIFVVTAVIDFIVYLLTGDKMYLVLSGIFSSAYMIFDMDEDIRDLKRRVAIAESKQRGFMSFETAIAAEQLDCKERVDNLTKTLNGDE